MWVGGQLHTLAALLQPEEHLVPSELEAACECFEKKLQSLFLLEKKSQLVDCPFL
jgi:hypothetical protein